jgi:hypothetical protein
VGGGQRVEARGGRGKVARQRGGGGGGGGAYVIADRDPRTNGCAVRDMIIGRPE